MQLGPNIPALATGLGQICGPYFMKKFGRKNCLYLYTYGASVMFVIAAQGQHLGMYFYWLMRICVGFLSCISLVLMSFIGEWYQDDKAMLGKMASGKNRTGMVSR